MGADFKKGIRTYVSCSAQSKKSDSCGLTSASMQKINLPEIEGKSNACLCLAYVKVRKLRPPQQAWDVLMAAVNLTVDNSTALAACREAAAKAKKEQHCTLVVPAL